MTYVNENLANTNVVGVFFVEDTDSSEDSCGSLDHCSDSDLVLVHSASPVPQATILLNADIGLGELVNVQYLNRPLQGILDG